jgi:prolipoprotein diacylglyceryl transferase
VWFVGPIPIRAYALCIIVGIIVAIWWGERRWAARGGERGMVMDLAVFAVPFGIVGARIYSVSTDWWRYFGPGMHPLDALKIWDGGIGIPGAIAGGAIGAWIACRRKGVPLPAMADTLAPGIVTAQAIGRIGNYFNQELYGRPTTMPWGLELYYRCAPNTKCGVDDTLGSAVNHTPVQVVHPTFLYELIWDLGVAALVVFAIRRFSLGHGRGFALYVAAYAVGRSWIELMRSDEATHILGIRINNWMMGLLFVGAVVYIVLAGRRGEQEDIAALTAGSLSDGASNTADPLAGVGASNTADPLAGVGASNTAAGAENPAPATDSGDTEDAEPAVDSTANHPVDS